MASHGISLAVLGKDCICRAQLAEAAVADLPITLSRKKGCSNVPRKSISPLACRLPLSH